MQPYSDAIEYKNKNKNYRLKKKIFIYRSNQGAIT
jgi:hypothetical protein